MNIRSTVLIAMSMSIFGCALAASQRIETNPEKWLSYEIHYAGKVVSLKVPPNHRFKDDPYLQYISPGSSEPITQIFTAQYDYGWRRWANVAQFDVMYTFVKLETPLPSNASPASIAGAVSRTYDKKLGRVTIGPDETSVEQATGDVDASWVREFLKADPYSEYYAKPCSPDLVLQVTVRYFKRDKVKDADWFKNRRALFHKMVSQVQCR